MITGIPSYAAIIMSSTLTSAKPEHTSRMAPAPDNAGRVKASPEGTGHLSPSLVDMGITAAGSVVFEPTCLLADLSGTGLVLKTEDSPPRPTPGAYGQASLSLPKTLEEPAGEPMTHTFEIIV